MKTTIDGVFVEVINVELCEKEIRQYLFYLRNKFKGQSLEYLSIKIDGDYVDLNYRLIPKDFVRLRRITGYLTQDLKMWNNAKRAEERDRVKHI